MNRLRLKRVRNARNASILERALRRAAAERSGNESGQALVLMVGGLLTILLAVAVTIDGGNAFAQQRAAQNGSDGAAEGGAVVIAQKLAGASTPAGGWDTAINSAVQANAAANNVAVTAAYYTDICGIPLTSTGIAALWADGTTNLAIAARVGSGFPTSSRINPDCPSRSVGPPVGVMVLGHKVVHTAIAGIVGMDTIDVGTQATAVAGYLQGYCGATQGESCAMLPVTIPVNVITCDGTNDPLSTPNPQNTGNPWALNQVYKVPLCENGPGNVGWIDWTPPSGGTSELASSITTPNNPNIDLPSWQFVTETGNINSSSVENALRHYDGEVVLIPQFDLTCGTRRSEPDPDSSQPAIATSPNYGCPAGDLGGNGQNNWYRMPSFAYFELCGPGDGACSAAGALHGSYVSGNNRSVCDTGNGATSCLVGRFVKVLATGTVSAGVGGGGSNNPTVGVQLIR
jgi:Flp pilus assembly protein TadG